MMMSLTGQTYKARSWSSTLAALTLLTATTLHAEPESPAREAAVAAEAAPSAPGLPTPNQALDERIQDLKQEVIQLNRELFALEEELLFPANTQVAVFLSVDVGGTFALDSVQLKIDNQVVTNYLYTEREVQAFLRGGVQRLFMGNLKAGQHEIVALFVGKGPEGRDYRRGATVNLDKGVGPAFLELKITDKTANHQPDFVIKQWE